MRRTHLAAAAATAGILCVTGGAASHPDLSFDQRIEAQRAIERVYYSHQTGATRPFDIAVPRSLLEGKVRTYLGQSVALERFWGAPVTAEALDAEMRRIASHTRFPGRLKEIETALHNDSFVIRETLARASLVDRLTRNFFASDGRIHGAALEEIRGIRERLQSGDLDPLEAHPRRSIQLESDPRPKAADSLLPATSETASAVRIGPIQDLSDAYLLEVPFTDEVGRDRVAGYRVSKRGWDDWWREVRHEFEESSVPAVASPAPLPPSIASCRPDDTWDNGILEDVPFGGERSSVWTGSLMLVWEGQRGGRYDPLTDTWSRMNPDGAPGPRGAFTLVWTGSEMILWGGAVGTFATNTGGRYDPVADSWTPVTTAEAPSHRERHSAVWTGAEMVIWGGYDLSRQVIAYATGGRYDPASDTWRPTSLSGAPEPRTNHHAIWTGSEMIVWGGGTGGQAGAWRNGGRYNPAADVWSPVSDAPLDRRSGHSVVWTGSEMIVWGGYAYIPICCSFVTSTGARYDPSSDSWAPTTLVGAPTARQLHSAIWTGDEMIVWGGTLSPSGLGGENQTGGRYDPASNTWVPTTEANAPGPRYSHAAFWDGSRMLVWGGTSSLTGNTGSGGRYDPSADSWTPTASTRGGPKGIRWPRAVWTGNEMIVWGGDAVDFYRSPAPGGRYDPLLDRWSSMNQSSAPFPRALHAVVWTGDEMIVWGGSVASTPYLGNDGARYDPISDSWVRISEIDAPEPRTDPLHVWTGKEMIVWGGTTLTSGGTATGGRYDPALDRWAPTTAAGAPQGRVRASAVWTGREMIVWGGAGGGSSRLGSGGRYDPVLDAWSATQPLDDFFLGRVNHSSVWTGREMIVWGGDAHGGVVGDGLIYDPAADGWRPFGGSGAPARRNMHSALWTGSRMVVWGGYNPFLGELDTGGVYDPATGSWSVTATAQGARPRQFHAAVWTGSEMIVWGGYARGALSDGGRYVLEQSVDNDADGFSECSGDCDDSGPTVYPGAPQVCGDGRNNDCLDPAWPSTDGTNESDSDRDGLSGCAGDCDDGDALVHPGAVELPGNRVDENCDGSRGACDPDGAWRNHGRFVSCVAYECRVLVASGAVSQPLCDALVSQAARMSIGKKPRRSVVPPIEP